MGKAENHCCTCKTIDLFIFFFSKNRLLILVRFKARFMNYAQNGEYERIIPKAFGIN